MREAQQKTKNEIQQSLQQVLERKAKEELDVATDERNADDLTVNSGGSRAANLTHENTKLKSESQQPDSAPVPAGDDNREAAERGLDSSAAIEQF